MDYLSGMDSGEDLMVVRQNGHVGIGTTDTDAWLTVESNHNGSLPLTLRLAGNDAPELKFYQYNAGPGNAGSITSMAAINSSFAIYGHGVTQPNFYIARGSGRVGIHTDNPRHETEINSHVLIPQDKHLAFGTEDTSSGHFMIATSAQYHNTYADYHGNLYFRITEPKPTGPHNKGAVMGLQKDGTVTIGVWEKYTDDVTDTDGHKLMVNGGILCEKVKVIVDVPNSDHVFESDYDLRSLEEVEQFVKENKHLPEIPSAAEFQENGYSIGEMDDLLLRKVEELTLYTIQLKKELDEVKRVNSELVKVVGK